MNKNFDDNDKAAAIDLDKLLDLAYKGLRDWETPDNRYRALEAIDKFRADARRARQAAPEAPTLPDHVIFHAGICYVPYVAPAATTASASDLRMLVANIPLPEASKQFQHGFVSAKEAVLSALPPRAPVPSRDADTEELREAAAAVVARWDSPLWRQEVGTSEFINRLRAAMSAATKQEQK